MRIETLSFSTSFPLALSLSAPACHNFPAEVKQHVQSGKLWHLIGWNDKRSNTFGFAHKGKTVAIGCKELLGLAIEIMYPAKGQGWVSLEAKVESQRLPVSLLESMQFSSLAVEWLFEHKVQLEALAGWPVTINDRGSDY